MGSHAWTPTRNQKQTGSLRPDGVECSVQPYDSEEMPAPSEMLFQMHRVRVLHSEFQPLLCSRCNVVFRVTHNTEKTFIHVLFIQIHITYVSFEIYTLESALGVTLNIDRNIITQ